jgi:fructosamine-3-kinase
MPNGIPIAVGEAISDILSREAPAVITGFIPIGGGCINHGGKLASTAGSYFLKWNSNDRLEGMFATEARGLALLRATHAIHVPEVITAGVAGDWQFLLLEFVPQQRGRNDYWETLGQQLAALHKIHGTASGLDHDNYIGSLPQSNKQHARWCDFFVHERLSPQLKRAVDAGSAPANWVKRFGHLFGKLDSLLPDEPVSLLHGDLWQGNIIINALGAPCLIDPAVYYGHREADLAMTQLFGGFDDAFYVAYREAYPLQDGYGERFELYNLYPLLVHLNLFGQTYRDPIESVLNDFA